MKDILTGKAKGSSEERKQLVLLIFYLVSGLSILLLALHAELDELGIWPFPDSGLLYTLYVSIIFMLGFGILQLIFLLPFLLKLIRDYRKNLLLSLPLALLCIAVILMGIYIFLSTDEQSEALDNVVMIIFGIFILAYAIAATIAGFIGLRRRRKLKKPSTGTSSASKNFLKF